MEALGTMKKLIEYDWGNEEKKEEALALVDKLMNGTNEATPNGKCVLSSGDVRANSIEYAMPCYEKEISGVIRWERPDGVSQSPSHLVGDLSWHLFFSNVNSYNVRVTLQTQNAPSDAYRDVRVQMYLVVQSGIDEGTAYRMPEFDQVQGIPFSTIQDNGFQFAGKIVIEARWTFTRKYVPKFADPVLSDAILVVEGKKIHVNKSYLAFYSPFFFTLFYGDFSDKNEGQIELKDLDYDHFIEYLMVLYPTRKEVNETNVEYLLQLADQYDTPCVTFACAAFLVNAEMDNLKKIAYADKYRLASVRKCAVYALSENKRQFVKLLHSDEFSKFSDETKALMREELARIRRVVN